MAFKKEFSIGGLEVGMCQKPLFLPDIGTFFNENYKVAINLIEQLALGGATCIKGEVLHNPNICSEGQSLVRYLDPNGQVKEENYRALINRKCLALDQYKYIFDSIKEKQLPIVMSVYDLEGAIFCSENGVSALKIASSNITHLRLIRNVASLELPMIIDTGHSTLSEISRAVEQVDSTNNTRLLLQHSPYPPPYPVSDQNIRAILSLNSVFGTPVGLSDHHKGEEMLFAAIALGAAAVEKGICLSSEQIEQDVFHALPVSDFRRVLNSCSRLYEGMGDGELRLDAEKKLSRNGLFVTEQGAVTGELVRNSTIEAFPCDGIEAEYYDLVADWVFKRSIPPNSPVKWNDVTPPDVSQMK